MARDEITGEPETIYCSICGEYIPHGQAADILGRYVCSDCEKQIMALARFVVSQVPMTIYDYGIEIKIDDAPGDECDWSGIGGVEEPCNALRRDGPWDNGE